MDFMLILLTLGLGSLEILAYSRGGNFAVAASRIWLVGLVYYTLISLLMIFRSLWDDVKKNQFWGLAAVLFVTLLVSVDLANFPGNSSSEATLQVASGLNNFEEKDFGYTATAFLGNPARQYVIVALPSFFFGRSIVNYRLGYLLPFLLGVYLFYCGLKIDDTESMVGSRVGSLAVLGIIAFPIVPVLMRTFEQIVLPLAFTLQVVGWILICRRHPKLSYLVALIWIGGMLSTTYTPALAAWILLLLILLTLSLQTSRQKKWRETINWLCCLFVICIFGISAIHSRTDLRFPAAQPESLYEMLSKVPDSLLYFFLKDTNMYGYSVPFVGQLLFFPLLIYLVGALMLTLGFPHLVIALWIIATVIFSGLAPGYARPPPSFGIHRAMVVVPVFLAAIYLTKWRQALANQRVMSTFFVMLCLFDLLNVLLFYQWSRINYFNPGNILLRETLKTAKHYAIDTNQPLQLTAITHDPTFRYFPDLLAYFFPRSIIPEATTPCTKSLDPSLSIIVFTDDPSCVEELKKSGDFEISEPFTYTQLNTTETITKAVHLIH